MMQLNPVYEPIQHDEIRLVKFGRYDGEHTSAVLQSFSLQKGPIPLYYALSYTWACGDPGTTQHRMLQIGKHQLPVLDSLQSFLHVLLSKDAGDSVKDAWWWIDSICIDLANVVERAQQVQLMGQIYHSACEVIVWLGEQSDDTDCAIKFIELLNKTIRPRTKTIEEIRSIFQRDCYLPQWAALTNFFQRKWWTRIWTLQEYAITASLSFWCGTRTVSRRAVEGALVAGDQCTALAFKELPAFRFAWNRRRVRNLYELEEQRLRSHDGLVSSSLVALAAYSSCYEATDDRDRLYGVRALATESSFLHVDYCLSTEEVYLRFAKAFIEHYKSLDIVCFASIFPAPPGSSLPSWVPDWRTEVDPIVVPLMVSQSSKTHIGNLRPPRCFVEPSDPLLCYATSQDMTPVVGFDGRKLLVHGIIADIVDGLAGSTRTKLVQSSSVLNVPPAKRCRLPTHSRSNLLMRICKSLVLDRKDRYLQNVMPTDEFFRDFLWFCAQLLRRGTDSTKPLIAKELLDWFEQTKSLHIHGYSIEDILRTSQRDSDTTNSSSASGPPNQDEHVNDSFFGRFFDTVVRMSLRLMVTRDGHIGMAPEKAMKGDIVCVLFGCSVPVLLRRYPGSGDAWTVVGECFIDGFMEGAYLEQSGLVETGFCIE